MFVLGKKQIQSLLKHTAEEEARGSEVGAGAPGPGKDIPPARPTAETGSLLPGALLQKRGPPRRIGPSPAGKAQPPADRKPAPAGCRTLQCPRPARPCRSLTRERRLSGEEGEVIRGPRRCLPPWPKGRLSVPMQVRGPGARQSLLPTLGRGAQLPAGEDRKPLPRRPAPRRQRQGTYLC